MYKTHKYYVKVTPAGQTVTWNTPHLSGEIVWIHVKPTTSTTQYSMKITDPDGLEVWESAASPGQGEVSELIDALPVDDILQVAITGATVDEVFEVKFRLREDVQNR